MCSSVCPPFRPFLEYVRQEVGKDCGWGQDTQHQQRAKFALQALGNAGVIPKDSFPQRCYKVRESALYIHRKSLLI